jgi:acetyl-CoA carboxylase biotin carboxylase subunit
MPHLRRGSDNNFLPSPGRSSTARRLARIREDSGATVGLDMPIFYDPIVSKLIAWSEDRPPRCRTCSARLANTSCSASSRPPFFTWLFDQQEFQTAGSTRRIRRSPPGA